MNFMAKFQDLIHRQEKESGQPGLNLDGLKRFFINEIEEHDFHEEFIFDWFENLGYDSDLYPIRSRCFVLSLHSSSEVDLQVRDAIQTDLDARTNLLIAEKFGQFLEQKPAYDIIYTFSEQILAYSYFVTNKLQT